MTNKTVHIKPKTHQKLKFRSVKNKSTIQEELNEILEKELKGENNSG